MTVDYDSNQAEIRRFCRQTVARRAMSELTGMATCMLYDGSLDDGEITLLREWCGRYSDLRTTWPGNELIQLMERILADGVVDWEERGQLLSWLENYATEPLQDGTATQTIFTHEPTVIVKSHSFLITGKLSYGPRKTTYAHLEALGGLAAASPRFNLDYLVVGSLGSSSWIQSRYGTKIKRIMDNIQEGACTQVIREGDLARAILAARRGLAG